MTERVSINLHKPFDRLFGSNPIYIRFCVPDLLHDPYVEMQIKRSPSNGYDYAGSKKTGYSLNLSRYKMEKFGGLLSEEERYYAKLLNGALDTVLKFRIRDKQLLDDIFTDHDNFDFTFAISKGWNLNGKWAESRLIATEFELYRRKITMLTDRQRKKKYFKKYIDKQGLLMLNDGLWELDHIYSVKEGFLNDIDEELISSLANLQVITAIENSTKGIRCDIEYDDLVILHEKLKRDLQ